MTMPRHEFVVTVTDDNDAIHPSAISRYLFRQLRGNLPFGDPFSVRVVSVASITPPAIHPSKEAT